jgi:hypothetical protein
MMFNNFNITIANPFSKKDFKSLYDKNGKITENKCWEFQIYEDDKLIKLSISLSFKTDHAGFNFEFGMFGYIITFEICDHRHWDYENNKWEEHEN